MSIMTTKERSRYKKCTMYKKNGHTTPVLMGRPGHPRFLFFSYYKACSSFPMFVFYSVPHPYDLIPELTRVENYVDDKYDLAGS